MQLNQCSSVALVISIRGHHSGDLPLLWSLLDCIRRTSLPVLASFLFAGSLLAIGCSPAKASSTTGDRVIETGVASYYSDSFQGRSTASGRRYNPWKLTAASPWLPLGSKVRVTASNGRSVEVEVTDRMAAPRRVIDLSYQAARMLGMVRQGVTYVTLVQP
jgi:rare lipoprotein A